MTSQARTPPTISDIMADLKMAVIMVHGRAVADEIPEMVYNIAAECSSSEADEFAGGVKALLCNLAGAVADGDLNITE